MTYASNTIPSTPVEKYRDRYVDCGGFQFSLEDGFFVPAKPQDLVIDLPYLDADLPRR